MGTPRGVKYLVGVLLTLNFVAYWSVPVAGMGMLYKYALACVGRPLADAVDNAPLLRALAAKYVYQKAQYSDYFAMSVATALSICAAFGVVLRAQLARGSLPWWLIFSYYCAWVGLGGRAMGTAYTMAHKEGHNAMIYQKWWRRTIGNLFENRLGVLYGNVPFNFQTSHVHIHHKLDGGVGDTFYAWDLDRASPSDFMLYLYRVLLHMTGISSLAFFDKTGRRGMYDKLRLGCMQYFVYVPAALLLLTKSFSFLFFIYVQPMLCMAFFLALLNVGFHGFIELDQDGKHIDVVNSTCIVRGDDDSFGEDDHYIHHYATTVYHRDLPEAHKARIAQFAAHKASVFEKLSILELSIFLIAGDFKKLAEHFVDYSGSMSKEEVAAMLERRARRKEMSHEQYEALLASGEAYKRHAIKAE